MRQCTFGRSYLPRVTQKNPMTATAGQEWRSRRRFTIVTFITAILLLGWGAFVTSINAGMAVPDWPTSFDSYDPFNPWPQWWTITPVLAEHGHRLLGALVGILTTLLALWTWKADARRWMRRLGMAALGLVIFQGILGGLRVVLISLDLAVVHAMVAQIYFSVLAAMILFVSPIWVRASEEPALARGSTLKRTVVITALSVYVQIFFGALLRHPGVGIDPAFTVLHLGFAIVVAITIVRMWLKIRLQYDMESDLNKLVSIVITLLGLQVSLGIIAYFVILDERGIVQPSNVQVIINSAHLIVGAMLFAATVSVCLLTFRRFLVVERSV